MSSTKSYYRRLDGSVRAEDTSYRFSSSSSISVDSPIREVVEAGDNVSTRSICGRFFIFRPIFRLEMFSEIM